MKRILFILILLAGRLAAQVSAPVIHCVSVNATGDVQLTWTIPADPLSQFTSYKVYFSSIQAGPYTAAGAPVTTYSQSTFTHVGANANAQARYYYVVTISNGVADTSAPSDTIKSIFLNANPLSGIVNLSWNPPHTPLLPSSAGTYTLSREYPAGSNSWTVLYNGPGLSFKDTISVCSIAFNYRVEISDNLGCTSQSNIAGGLYHDQTSPRVPVFDSVSVNPNGSTSFGWNPSTSPDTYAYIIYKQISGVWTPIDTVYGINNTAYTYSGSSAGTSAENYCIASLDSCKNVSPLGGSQQTMYLTNAYDICSRSATLSWSAYGNLPRGIQGYDIYCSANGGPFSLVGSTISLTFVHSGLAPGTNYCYFVRVNNTTHDISSSSNISCTTASGANGPSYVYIRSASVNAGQQVEVSYIMDNSKPSKGVKIYRSADGVNFAYLASSSATSNATYTDAGVNCKAHNYWYRVSVMDTCGNEGAVSNVAKTIVMTVKNDHTNIFYNVLTWDDYSGFQGGVASYNIYRSVNGVFNPVPVANVPVGNRGYTDDVSDFVSDNGKFSYYVQAMEGPGNTYGLQDSARSNIADAYAEVTVFVPSAFAPKGLNSVWLPVAQYVEKTDYKVTVFDRWGARVFETNSDTQGWDGAHAIDDVYAYLIQYKNARGEFIELKGTVTLLR